ncbi:MAG: tartrate dehydrogenase [Firmicutes bacterium HGW-Firmicutes-3]|jgi:tartrate dehydrogenase/decarboxylase/D-malate dehydrogenase|nr:MAG: tartrate dehydrogenase [Firmicutes bacterium HGW-Firmicutes-3]
MNKKIAVIPGDGIGTEVMEEGVKVLQHYLSLQGLPLAQLTHYPWGCEYYHHTGRMMPEDGMLELEKYDAILLGAVGYPGVPDHISLRELLLKIRQGFDQSINLRPIKLLNGAPCPLKNKTPKDIDFVVVRENVEGEYSGHGEFKDVGTDDEAAHQTGVFTKKNTDRVMKYAFELSQKRNRAKKLTSATKSNALNYSMVFWDNRFNALSENYPDIKTEVNHVDAISMYFVQRPESFDVVVASNLFGDIITDLGAALQGGLGFAASANLNIEGTYPSMFEPVHGSAPEIAGKQIANPMAMIWTVKMMLDQLYPEMTHDIIVDAIEAVLVDGKCLTRDLGGKSTTSDVGSAICNALNTLIKK